MAFVDDVAAAAAKSFRFQSGAFYGSAEGLAPGAGVIYDAVAYPIFNSEVGRFQARTGPVLILTHECDIDSGNERAFNTELLVAPLILMSSFAQQFDTGDDAREYGKVLAANIAAGNVPRLSFLPPHLSPIDRGAFLFFNALTSSHISLLAEARAICALSEYGLGMVDNQLRNHLFRPKADSLARLK